MDDILVLEVDNNVVWYSEGGNRRVRQFSFEVEPLDAIFCSFPSINLGSSKMDMAIAILVSKTQLHLYQINGDHFDINLDFDVECMHAATDGLLFQCVGGEEEKTTLYSLPHPITLPKPVILFSNAQSCGKNLDVSEVEAPGHIEEHHSSSATSGMNNTGMSFSISQNQSSMLYQEHLDESEKLVAVRGNAVVTCSVGDGGCEDTVRATLKLWMLRTERGGAGYAEIEPMFSGNQAHNVQHDLPPLAPVPATGNSAASTFRSINSKINSSGASGSGIGGSSPRQSPSASPTLQMLQGLGGMTASPTEVIESALGVSSTSSFNPRLDKTEGGIGSRELGHGKLGGTRSPSQQLMGRYASTDMNVSNVNIPGVASAARVNQSLWSYFSANTAEEQSLSLINALSNAELSIQLLDTAQIATEVDLDMDGVEVHFTGDSEVVGGLLLQFLHRPTGTHRMFAVSYDATFVDATKDDRNNISGSLVPLPPIHTAGAAVGLAHMMAPVGLASAGSPGLVAPFTFLLQGDSSDNKRSQKGGSIASILIGASHVGDMRLQWTDDLYCGPSPAPVAPSLSRIVSCGSASSCLLVSTPGEMHHLLSLSPAHLLSDKTNDACSLDVLASALSALKMVQNEQDTRKGISGRDKCAVLAEEIMGLMMLCESSLGLGSGVELLVHAIFGHSLDDIPAIAEALSRPCESRSEDLEAHIARLYRSIAMSVDEGSREYENFRVTLFGCLHATLEDLLLRDVKGDGLKTLVRTMSYCVNVSGGTLGRQYYNYYCGLGITTIRQDAPSNLAREVKFAPEASTVPSAAAWIADCIYLVNEVAITLRGGEKSQNDMDIDMDALAYSKRFPHFAMPPRLKGAPGATPCPALRITRKFLQSLLMRVSMPYRHTHQQANARIVADAYLHPRVDSEMQHLEYLPPLLRSLVDLALFKCRPCPNLNWTDKVLIRIGREDLCREHSSRSMTGTSAKRGAAEALSETAAVSVKASGVGSTSHASDGLEEVEAAASLRFAEDDRVHEACRMLRSSTSIYLRVEKAPEVSDLDHRSKLQHRLLCLCRRSLASSVGRGMLTLGSLEPLIAEALPVPPLNLSGRVPPNDSIVNLDTASAPAELTLWPDFHNGVAAGLRVGLSGKKDGPNQVKITRYWIIYNRTAASAAAAAAVAARNANTPGPSNVSTESAISSHAGLLLALGLQGHLDVLSKGDICDYLTQGHEPTTIAMLLGIAASKIGSADPHMSKTLCLYLPTLLPPRHWDINISPLVQTAALAGLGLLHAGSGHRLITEFLLAELSRRPLSDRCDNRETMAMAASWALGLVLLGKGGKGNAGGSAGGDCAPGMEGLVDLRIDDRLCQLFTGGRKPEESHLFPTVLNPVADGGSRASRILEGDDINVDVTGPGALIALALIYLKTNNSEMARRMTLPDTVHSLDAIRPDHLLYRALAISLIMWDSVRPSEAWIDEQVPATVGRVLFPSRYGTPGPSEEHKKGHLNMKPHDARQLLPRDALHLYMCTITGYCCGMGLVFAGTSDERAKSAILSKLKFLQGIRDNRPQLELSIILDRTIKPLVDMCVSVVAVSLSVVMAGSGDIDCLRTVRELRWRVDDVNFGTHMALSMSIGMLFLAGGNASVKRDPLSIACLLLCICPRYPARTVDNQFHLQAFRHMYVVAVENRVLKTVDVDSGEPVPVTVDMVMRDGACVTMRAPCLLPELDSIAAVRVTSNEDALAMNAKKSQSQEQHARIKLDLFCNNAEETYQPRTANQLYPLEVLFEHEGADKPEGKREQDGGRQRWVKPEAVQDLKVKKERMDTAMASKGPDGDTNLDDPEHFLPSASLQRSLAAFVRARGSHNLPSLLERAETGLGIYQEATLRMLKGGSGEEAASRGLRCTDAILSRAVETCEPLISLTL